MISKFSPIFTVHMVGFFYMNSGLATDKMPQFAIQVAPWLKPPTPLIIQSDKNFNSNHSLRH